ncbi:MAG: Rpn family recombination-promoting nuclease/putative transposase, partial [Clostridium sp.]|nr:Rpn family recombination-promoting nuclease/putative transposase [Clostridium sp.]
AEQTGFLLYGQEETMEKQRKQGQAAPERRTGSKQQETPKYQEADVSSKRIFGNPTLCAQFLRDYSGLPMLANVQPEDIEDVSERYHLFREVELQADTVKKVHIREQEDGEARDIYILSLIDHKSYVDHDVTMQILKYMVCIWENEAKEQEAAWERETQALVHSRKDFRYPPIYPIVYYEGAGEWTATRSLRERILCSDLFRAYIPDFTYRLVRTQDYSNEELLSKEDEISLLMLLNKIQQAKDFEELRGIQTERLNDVMQRAPVDVAEIIISAVRSLCNRLNMTEEETGGYIKEVRGGNMGYLWENMEKMDIQLERRNTAEQRQRAEEAEQRADKAEQKLDEALQIGRTGYRLLLANYQQQGMDREAAGKLLITEAGLDEKQAGGLLEMFWQT